MENMFEAVSKSLKQSFQRRFFANVPHPVQLRAGRITRGRSLGFCNSLWWNYVKNTMKNHNDEWIPWVVGFQNDVPIPLSDHVTMGPVRQWPHPNVFHPGLSPSWREQRGIANATCEYWSWSHRSPDAFYARSKSLQGILLVRHDVFLSRCCFCIAELSYFQWWQYPFFLFTWSCFYALLVW